MEHLGEIIRQVGVSDILDVILVAALFYVILSWLWGGIPESALRKLLIAAPVIAAVYVLIRVFDLYLLEEVLEILFLVLLIIAVVVFQSDIRRMFDRMVGGVKRTNGRAEESATIDAITETVAKLAARKIGALIAIRGREPLDSHIHGGIALDGMVTQPLLHGIFYPDTPGHDGAVIIEEDRVTMFAVHLPLATNLPEVSQYGGTRHAAALGLAEESDALVIVVSEERGTIGIAQDGQLDQDVNVGLLRQRMEEFWNGHYRRRPVEYSSWWRSRRVQPAAVSVLLSVILWLFVIYSPDTVVRTLTVPIEYQNLPDDWALEPSVPTEVQIVIAGRQPLIRRLDSERLAVSVDLENPEIDPAEIVITREELGLPSDIDLIRVEPSAVPLELNRLRSIHLPVRVPALRTLPDSLTLVSIRTEPDSVTLLTGTRNGLSASQVETMSIDLSRVVGDTTIDSRLVLPPESRLPADVENEVAIQIEVQAVED